MFLPNVCMKACMIYYCVPCTVVVLKGIIRYSDYLFKIVIFESFETNRIFISF